MQRGPFLRRLAARILDLLFSLLLTFVVALPMSIIVVLVGPAIEPFVGRPFRWGITAALCYVIAYVVWRYSFSSGETGKLALRS
jgi:hypothetical protein